MTVATNLKDMIRLITSRPLQHDLVEAHIPKSGIDWAGLDDDLDRRAGQIYDALLNFKSSRQDEQQSLIGSLSVIAALNAEGGNQTYIQKQIRLVAKLNQDICFYPFNCKQAHTTANLAAWIKMKSMQVESARDIWDELVGVAQTQQEKNNQWRIFPITKPTKKNTEFEAGIEKFKADFKALEESKGTSDDFDSEVFPSTMENFTRYIINTTKPLRDVKMREKDKDGNKFWKVGKDNQQTGFIIDHYFARDYIAISRVISADEEEIATLFALNVFGSDIIKEAKRHFDLAPFATSAHKNFLKLPEINEKYGDRIWISGLEFAFADKSKTPYPNIKFKDFAFSPKEDIHEHVKRFLKSPAGTTRDLAKVRVTLQLWNRIYEGGRHLVDKSKRNEYIFTLSPTRFTSDPKIRNIKNDYDFRLINSHLKQWCFEGTPISDAEQKKADAENG